MAVQTILELQNVKRAFGSKVVLRGVDLSLARGELIALYGPSGSGKSTLLNLVGAIDRPSEGTIRLVGRDVSRMWEMNRTKLRRTQIGFIFQNYPLIAAYSAAENIDMSLRLKGIGLWERRRRIKAALEAVGLSEHARRLPDQLSGGQQQRVAIARVLALHPTIILADEPTSGLDTRTARRVMKIFQGLAEAEGTAFLVVSHDIDLTERFVNRAYDLRDGQLALRPPVGTILEDPLEARRKEALSYAHDHPRDDWGDDPEFLASLELEETPLRLGDPEFLRGSDGLPIEIKTEPSAHEAEEITNRAAESADTPAPQDIAEPVSESMAQNVSEITEPQTPEPLTAEESKEDNGIEEGAVPAQDDLSEPVEDVVKDADTTDAPITGEDDQAK